jgi:uncharacterized membrane protein
MSLTDFKEKMNKSKIKDLIFTWNFVSTNLQKFAVILLYQQIKPSLLLEYNLFLFFLCIFPLITAFENSPSIPSFLVTKIVYIGYGQLKK